MRCEIVSFYSFKGGTGRSTSLTNVAYALAEQGARVGCMDFDLAAPGLHMIFDVGFAHLRANKIHDYLQGDRSDIEEYVIDVNDTWEGETEGELYLIAGAIEPPGHDNARNMMDRALSLLDEFKNNKDLDYLLLDSRSGLSVHMFPIFDEADDFLAFHRWTDQHKKGTKKLADWVRDIGPDLDDVMSVASNVPHSVLDEDIEAWVRKDLKGVSEHAVINSSEILKDNEQVVTRTHPDSPVAGQYRDLADSIASF